VCMVCVVWFCVCGVYVICVWCMCVLWCERAVTCVYGMCGVVCVCVYGVYSVCDVFCMCNMLLNASQSSMKWYGRCMHHRKLHGGHVRTI